jgi:hypothetical protein
LAELTAQLEQTDGAAETLVWHAELGDWTEAANVPELRRWVGEPSVVSSSSKSATRASADAQDDAPAWAPSAAAALSELVCTESSAAAPAPAPGTDPAALRDTASAPVAGLPFIIDARANDPVGLLSSCSAPGGWGTPPRGPCARTALRPLRGYILAAIGYTSLGAVIAVGVMTQGGARVSRVQVEPRPPPGIERRPVQRPPEPVGAKGFGVGKHTVPGDDAGRPAPTPKDNAEPDDSTVKPFEPQPQSPPHKRRNKLGRGRAGRRPAPGGGGEAVQNRHGDLPGRTGAKVVLTAEQKRDIYEAARRQANALNRCVSNVRALLPPGTHRIAGAWTINPDGTVANPRLLEPQVALATSLDACFQRTVALWRFPSQSSSVPVSRFVFGSVTRRP